MAQQRLVGAPARQLISQARAVLAATNRLRDAPRVLRVAIEQEVTAASRQQVDQQLRSIPVDRLREMVARGIRFGELERSRYRTVADLLVAGPGALDTVPGIGPASARALHQAALELERQVRQGISIRLDPELRSGEQTELLRLLFAVGRADRGLAGLLPELDPLIGYLESLLEPAGRATGRWRMWWARRPAKAAALAAVERLDASFRDPRVVELLGRLDRGLQSGDPASPELADPWAEYERNAAAVNVELSRVPGAFGADTGAAGHGFVPSELIKAVDAISLRTDLMRSQMRRYQEFGAKFALRQQRCIIGDEMGVGKTIQALAVAAHLAAASGPQRVLVICPASVLINWAQETSKHTALPAHSLHGDDRDQAAADWARAGGIGITTFGTVDKLAIEWITLLIVDEAHFVKNPEARRSQAVAALAARTDRVIFLTGTPMENRVEEFRSLVAYLQPELAGTLQVGHAVAGARAFRRAVAPVYLRRNQDDVLAELPERIEVEDWVIPGPADLDNYRRAVRSRNFMAMRQAGYAAGSGSAKVERIVEIIEEAAAAGRKVLLFSYFLATLDVLAATMPVRWFGPLTGAVPALHRQRLVDKFAAAVGPAVLLSQIEAGGVGLNIQAASVVIIAEPQWKPSTEVQAIGRAHRMGQTRSVLVYRILAKGGVDERIREVLDGKIRLFDAYARRSEAKESAVGAADGSHGAAPGPRPPDPGQMTEWPQDAGPIDAGPVTGRRDAGPQDAPQNRLIKQIVDAEAARLGL